MGLALILTLCLCSEGLAQPAPPNTAISNIARATYSHGNLNGLISESNIVTIITVDFSTQSTLDFLRYAPANPQAEFITVSPTYFNSTGAQGGPYEPLAPPLEVDGTSEIDLSAPVPLISATHFAIGEPVFIRLADGDQNADSAANETILISLASDGSGEGEILRLSETNRSSGIFTGYIQSTSSLSAAIYDGYVTAREGNILQGNYNDIFDPGDTSADTLTFVRPGIASFVIKSAGKNIVSAGDYVQYNIRIENATTTNLDDLAVFDNLPNSTRYQEGSTTIDGIAAGDPQISSDGRILSFNPGILTPGERREIGYVVEIGPTARPGELTNEAYAADATGIISNIALATVRIREELFTNESFVSGRVMIAECDTSGEVQAGQGIAGVRIYLEDGTYAVTDSNGLYHFEGIAPGTHVLQLDREELPEQYEAASCDENSQFAGSPYSKFVDIQAGISWQADFQVRLKPRPVGELKLRLSSVISFKTVSFRVDMAGSVVPLRDLRLIVMLPEQLKFMSGSCRLMADSAAAPSISGEFLTFDLGDRPADWTDTLKFDAMLRSSDTSAELGSGCMMLFDTPLGTNQKSPIVKNTLAVTARKDREPLTPVVSGPYYSSYVVRLDSVMEENPDDIAARYGNININHIYITGHSDSSAGPPGGGPAYPANYAFSLAQAKEVGEYLARELNLDSSQVSIIGEWPDEPAIDENAARGRDLDRRIDIGVISEKRTKSGLIDIIKDQDSLSVTISGLRPGESSKVIMPSEKPPETFADFIQRRLEDGNTGFEWLWPPENHNPPIPSLKVAIKHYPDNVPSLFLDGHEVSSLNFSETSVSVSGSTAVSVWSGIDIHEGLNRFKAVEWDKEGQKTEAIIRSIHYSGSPMSVQVVDSLSHPTADGRTPAVVAVRFTDADGYPARPGVIGEWSVDPPYTAQQDIEQLQANPLLKVAGQKPKYCVGENGIALIELQATSESGEAVLRFQLIDEEKKVRVRLRPQMRDWVLVGLAERTLGYNAVSGNRDNLADAGIDNKTNGAGRASFFARGGIKGNKLLTLAFDSRRLNSNPDSGVFRTINPLTYYPLYGDGMQQGYDVSSSRGIYAKVEAADYYGVFGDYNTGLNATELSRYMRTFNGLKFEGGNAKQDLNMFLSRSNQAFVRDEIQGNGTSGPYHLSRDKVVANSERVVIETRDRFQNDIIISIQSMRQFIDYNLDYYTGEVFFKRPIGSRDEHFNPIFITVGYESNDSDDWSHNFGGRGGLDIVTDKLAVGGTYVREGRIGGYGHLGSIDVVYDAASDIQLKAEIAATKVKEGADRSAGNAYYVEIRRIMSKLSGALSFRDLEPGFGLGQQNYNERGTRKYRADVSYRLRDYLNLNGQVYSQSYLVTDSRRDFVELKFNMMKKHFTAQTGIRYAQDRLGDGITNRSSQLIAGGTYKIWADRLELRLMQEQSIIKNDNPDFPTRTTLGAEYRVSQHLTFFGEQDFATGHKDVANDTRFGFKSSPWKGAQVTSSIGRSYNENAKRLFSNLGLFQAWQINDRLNVDFSLDHGQLIRRAGNLSFNPNQTPASGNPDGFTALSVGASYREKTWSGGGRIEFRDSRSDDKLGITTNVFGEPRRGLGLLLAARINKSDAATGLKKRESDVRLGLVHRPRNSKWMTLNRLDLNFTVQKGALFNYDNWRLVDNITTNCEFSKRVSLAFQYGAKYLRESIGPHKYSGYMDLIGLESRENLTGKWDIGQRFNLLHSWNLRQYQYGSGISSGYNLFKNAWASIGYNFKGFSDRDFSDGNYTARGPYLQFRFKFDDTTAKDIAGRLGF
jgi:uncharacterized repeat protein (TIGR01451 family)